MPYWLRATSPTTVVIGPFVSTGATAQTAIECSAATIVDFYKLTAKSDITTSAAGTNAMAHVANGYYSLVLTSGNTDTVGPFKITADSTGSMSVWHDYSVIPAAIYDSLMTGTTTLDASFANGAQASSLLAMGVSVASSLVWVASAHAQVLVASASALANLAYQSTLTAVDTVVDAIKVDTASSLVWVASAHANVATMDAIVDAIKVETASSLVWIASAHAQVLVASASALANLAYQSTLTAVDTVVDSIKVETASSLVWIASAHANIDLLQTDMTSSLVWVASAHANIATIDTVVDAVRVDVTSVLTNYAQASLLATVDTVVDAIRVDVTSVLTNYAQASLLATVDTVVDAIRVDVTSVLTNYAQASLLATVDGVVDAIKLDTASSLTRIPAALVSGRIDASVGAMAANVMTTAAMTVTYVDEIVDAVWDEVLTAATHNVASSAGRRLRSVDSNEVTAGTAQDGSTNTITLAASESSTDNWFDPGIILIDSGTGAGQARRIIEYNGSTKVATVSRGWRTNPTAGSTYIIFVDGGLPSLNDGAAAGGTASSITLDSVAVTDDDAYIGGVVSLVSGTGKGQNRVIVDYDGATKKAYIQSNWVVNPVAGTGYFIAPGGRTITAAVVSGAMTTEITDAVSASFASLDTLIDTVKVDTASALVWIASAHTNVGLLQVDMTSSLVNMALLPTAATINAQVLDVMNVDTFAEPGQGAPAATASVVSKLGYVYKFLRNKIETTSSQTSVYADNGTTVDQKSTISDDGTTFTRGEFGTGA